MKTLALLQNQWFTPQTADKMRAIMARAATPVHRARLASFFLFRGCHTGCVLKRVFGAERCQNIIWENASPLIGDKPSAVFPPDPAHLRTLLETFHPEIIIAFGKVAEKGVELMTPLFREFYGEGACHPRIVIGPHPAARGLGQQQRLRDMVGMLLMAEAGPAMPAR